MRASSEYWTLIGLAARRIEQRLALSELTITDVEILRGLLHRAIAEAQGTSAASEVDKECCRFLSVCADNIALVQNKRYADASTHFLAYIEPLVPTKTVVVEARRLAILRAGMAEAEQMLKQGAERESVDFLRSFVASVNLGAGVQEQVADRIAQIERQHVRRLKERFDVTCSADRYGEACEGLIAMQREYPEAVETKVAHSTLAGRWPSFVTNLQHKEKHVEALREVETMLQYQVIGKDVGVALCVPHLSGNARLADGSADRYASVVRKLDPACGELVAYDDAAEAKRKEAEAKEKAVMEEELKRLLSLAREAQAVRDEYDRLKLKAYGDTSSTSTTEVQLYLQTKVLPVADQLEKLAESFAARFGLERLRDEANKHNFADILR